MVPPSRSAAMLATASAPRGMAVASPVQRHPMLPRSNAVAARPSSHGSTWLPAVAPARSPVAAAANGISSQAATKAAEQALPGLLAAASAAVEAWSRPAGVAVQLVAVVASAALGCKLMDAQAQKEFEERCKHEEPAAVMAALRSELAVPTGRLMVYFCFFAAAGLLFITVYAAMGVAAGAADMWLFVIWLAFGGRRMARDDIEAMWASRMLRQGAASSGGQQPGMP